MVARTGFASSLHYTTFLGELQTVNEMPGWALTVRSGTPEPNLFPVPCLIDIMSLFSSKNSRFGHWNPQNTHNTPLIKKVRVLELFSARQYPRHELKCTP